MPCEHIMPRFLEKKNRWSYVSCGQCTSCRISHMQEWKLRLLMEQQYHADSCFVTLTYDEDSISRLPDSKVILSTKEGDITRKSLLYEDLTLFWKRLRDDVDIPIMYYACGEYGTQVHYPSAMRPHFHAIVFGLGVNAKTRQLLKDNWRYCDSYRFDGVNAGLAYAEADSMLYVSSYVRKKLVGKLGKQEYYDKGLVPPDSRSSNGIGYQWYCDNRDQVLKDLNVTFQGRKFPIPRYFVKKDEELEKKLTARAFSYKYEKLAKLGFSTTEIFTIMNNNCLDILSRIPNSNEDYYSQAHQFNLNIETKLSLFQMNNTLEVDL